MNSRPLSESTPRSAQGSCASSVVSACTIPWRLLPFTAWCAAELVTRMYAGRADSENQIKELKEDLSLDTFCLQSFDATAAAFRTGCVLYNLLLGFRETVLPTYWFERRLRAVRDLVFLVGADLLPHARRLLVRFAVPRAVSGASYCGAVGMGSDGGRRKGDAPHRRLRGDGPDGVASG